MALYPTQKEHILYYSCINWMSSSGRWQASVQAHNEGDLMKTNDVLYNVTLRSLWSVALIQMDCYCFLLAPTRWFFFAAGKKSFRTWNKSLDRTARLKKNINYKSARGSEVCISAGGRIWLEAGKRGEVLTKVSAVVTKVTCRQSWQCSQSTARHQTTLIKDTNPKVEPLAGKIVGAWF